MFRHLQFSILRTLPQTVQYYSRDKKPRLKKIVIFWYFGFLWFLWFFMVFMVFKA